MRHPFFAASRPLLFAHRGGSRLAPENTIAAFDQAVALGVDGLELDVHLSRDGVAVVHHDASLARTTHRRAPVASLTAADLAGVDAAARFVCVDAARWAGQKVGVPRLAEVLARYPHTRIIIELKVNEPALAEAVLADVVNAGAEQRVCLGASGARVLRAARRLAPHVATSAARHEVRWALYRSWIGVPASHPAYGGYQVPEWAGWTRVVSPRFIEAAHAAGVAVQVWTVDAPADAERLLRWGVDGLISDRPDLLLPLFRR